MRLFIAINFNDNTKKGLLALLDELCSHCERGRFSAPENLHLTLAFLGECDAKQTSAVKAVMDEIKFEPFPITIERVGRFRRECSKQGVPAKSKDFVGEGTMTERARFSPLGGNEHVKSIATWWAGVQESKPLAKLHGDLTDKLISAGFILDKRKFNPHITLGRAIVTNVMPWTVEPFGEIVTSIELMKSERINGKLTYTAIYDRKA